jgi:hypothetical protein
MAHLLQNNGGPLKAILGYGIGEQGDDGHSPTDSQGGNKRRRGATPISWLYFINVFTGLYHYIYAR